MERRFLYRVRSSSDIGLPKEVLREYFELLKGRGMGLISVLIITKIDVFIQPMLIRKRILTLFFKLT